MKKSQVWQYTCDFCGKKSLSAGHMKNHEKHCTMNPGRECRVCKMVADDRDADFMPVPLSVLVAMLPDSKRFNDLRRDNNTHWASDPDNISYWAVSDELEDKTTAVLPELRKAAGDCPACIMAALRQAGIPVPMAKGFSFTNEMKEIWDGINQSKADRGY